MRLFELTSLPKYGNKFPPKHVGPLDYATDDDVAAIRWYTGHGYSPINAQLRGYKPEFERGSDDDMWNDYGVVLSNEEGIEAIDRIIADAPKRAGQIKVFRGETNLAVTQRYLEMEIGQSYTDPGYLSTTFDPTYAFYSFAQSRRINGEASNAISMYLVPPSVPGAYMHFDGEAVEKEFVLARGCTFTLKEKRVIPVKNKGYPVKEINLLIWKVKGPGPAR